jgi:hypothetical protein
VALASCKAVPPTQAPLALYSGIVTFGPDGTGRDDASTSLRLPAPSA